MKGMNFGSKRELSVCFVLLTVFTVATIPAYADQVIKPTSGGTIDVGFSTDPTNPDTVNQTMLKINFINIKSQQIQPHIDYYVTIMQGSQQINGVGSPAAFLHTAEGAISIPIQFTSTGTYQVNVAVVGIVFQPLPTETVSFTVNVGENSNNNTNSSSNQTAGTLSIPRWVKNTAGWWSSGSVGDQDFVKGIQWLIQNGIMHVPQSGPPATTGTQTIPPWIKHNAGWWASGALGDQDFVKGIQWLISNGIIAV